MHIDLIIESENVFTGTDAATKPAAVATSGDRIVAVGPRADVHAFARTRNEGPAPEVRDFGDALVVPGFHDSHLHFFHSAVYASPLATMFLGENEADCVERMRAFAEQRPSGWLLAQGWREYRWDPPVLPSKRSLDEAFPTRPVALYSGDAHTLWLNSTALSELGLTRDSVPPAGGTYDRDEAGELTGIVREAAAMELMPQIMGSFTDDEVASAYRGFFARLAENGVTSVCDMSLMAHPGLDFIRDDVHAALLERGELTARVHLFPTLTGDMGRFETMRARYTGPCLQAPGFKQFFDGVSSQHTAWVTEPYANALVEGDCGRPTVDAAVMRSYVLAAAEQGYPVRIHTIGDAAIHAALDIFEEARAKFGPLPEGRRNCLEHLENFLPEDLDRLAELQVVAAVQPPHMTLDPGGPERDLGPERAPLHVAAAHAARPLHGARVRNGLARGGRELDRRAVQRGEPPRSRHARARRRMAARRTHRHGGGPARLHAGQRRGGGPPTRAGNARGGQAGRHRRARPQPADLRDRGHPENEGAGHLHGRPLRVRE